MCGWPRGPWTVLPKQECLADTLPLPFPDFRSIMCCLRHWSDFVSPGWIVAMGLLIIDSVCTVFLFCYLPALHLKSTKYFLWSVMEFKGMFAIL